jgi:hypothetical protein
MKIEFTETEPTRLRVRYNGRIVFDEILQPGPHNIEVKHPTTCGRAEAFLVEDDGSTELSIGSVNYGPCNCSTGSHQ